LFCSNRCFKHHKKALEAAASKAKVRVLWNNEGHVPIINSIAVMIDSLASIVLDCFTRFQSSRVHYNCVFISTYFPVVILFFFQHTPVLGATFVNVGHIQNDDLHSFECAALYWLR